MRFSMVRKIHDVACDVSVKIGSRVSVWDDSNHDVFMFRRLNVIEICGAWRLAKWVCHTSGKVMYMVREDLWRRLKGRIVKDPTDAELDTASRLVAY